MSSTTRAKMDQIDDCFVKFFLRQAVEVEPESIQALIDHGYKSKLSLLAMDLVLDLPNIKEISMAQRSILRRYIGTLQDYSPFTLSIDDEALKKYQEPKKGVKKRKYEVLADDSDDDDYHAFGHSASSSHVLSPRAQALANGPNPFEPNSTERKAFNGVTLPSNISPVKPRRVSIKYVEESEETKNYDEEIDMQEEHEPEIEQPKTSGRGGKGKGRGAQKKEVIRTASQIRYEQMKQAATSPVSSNGHEEEPDEEEEELAVAPVVAPVSRRRTVAATMRKSVTPAVAAARASMAPVRSGRSSVARKTLVQETPEIKPENDGHIPTAAELAIRAKIEAKKIAGSTTKSRRTRKN